jgi:hypothetical protein
VDQPYRKADAYTWQHKHRRNTDIHASSGIEPTMPVFEQAKIFYAWDRPANVMDPQNKY